MILQLKQSITIKSHDKINNFHSQNKVYLFEIIDKINIFYHQ